MDLIYKAEEDESDRRMTATEVQASMAAFRFRPPPGPMKMTRLTLHFVDGIPEEARQRIAESARQLYGDAVIDLRPARPVQPPPAKPHPLQKLSGTPNGWGQSMWRPWE